MSNRFDEYAKLETDVDKRQFLANARDILASEITEDEVDQADADAKTCADERKARMKSRAKNAKKKK